MSPNSTREEPLVIIGEADSDGNPLAHIISGPGGDAVRLTELAEYPDIDTDNIYFLSLRVTGSRSGFFLGSAPMSLIGRQLSNILVADCIIDGMYDHKTQTDLTANLPFLSNALASKWGIFTGPITGSAIVFNTIENVKREHAIYAHMGGSNGDLVDAVDYYDTDPFIFGANTITEVGRTEGQFTARAEETFGDPELAANRVPIIYAMNYSTDNALAPGDGCKGGSGNSYYGNHRSPIFTTLNLFRSGYDDLNPGLADAVRENCNLSTPFTGAIRNTAYENDGAQSEEIHMIDNIVTFAPDAGDRELVRFSGVKRAFIENNTIQAGATGIALELADSQVYGPMEAYCVKGNQISGSTELPNGQAIVQPAGFNVNCE